MVTVSCFTRFALTMGVLLNTAHAGPLQLPRLETRAVGFQAVPQRLLDMIDLQDATCLGVLKQTINCESTVAQLGQNHDYQGSLDDPELTDAVCATSCRTALTTARRRIQGACTKTVELLPGRTTLSFIDKITSGWNETCLKDEDSGDYCNDIIDSWEEVDDLEDMPEDELCSYCWGAKLRMMQQSEYSAYDEYFADMLEYVNEQCDVDSPTTPINEPPTNNGSQPERCYSGKAVKTASGDTCDKIALANSVSSSTLFYLNANLPNCSSIPTGLDLCLPEECSTRTLQDSEDCVDVAMSAGITWNKIVEWNAMIDYGCTNIHSKEPFWGRTLCISAPGGDFEDGGPGHDGDTGNGNSGGEGGSGNGYADKIVDPPEDGEVAEGTTKQCGHYVQAKDGVDCAKMIITANKSTPMDLFLKINPTLGTAAKCDDNLETGLWYCLSPVYGWDVEQPKPSE